MTNHKGPEICRNMKPEDQCQAVAKGNGSPSGWPEWAKKPHQCPRRGQGSRAGRIACWQHLQKEDVKWVDETENAGEG